MSQFKNPVPEKIGGKTLYEIPTNDEGRSFWLDEVSHEMYDWNGDGTDAFFHSAQQTLPVNQRLDPFGYPFIQTAQEAGAALVRQLLATGSLDGLTGKLVDRSGSEYRLDIFPETTEEGPAQHWSIELERKGKHQTVSAGLVASALLRYTGKNRERNALTPYVETLKLQLGDGSEE